MSDKQRKAFERAYSVIMGSDVDHGFGSFNSGCYAYPRLQGAWVAWQRADRPPEEYRPCSGTNCGTTDGRNHSPECQAEHAAAVASLDPALHADRLDSQGWTCQAAAIRTLIPMRYTWAGGELWEPPIGPRPSRFGGPAAEIDYEALIQYGWKHFRYRQGTKECVAFAKGAEWMGEQVLGSMPAYTAETLLSLLDLHASNLAQGANAQACVTRDTFKAILAATKPHHSQAVADPNAPCDLASLAKALMDNQPLSTHQRSALWSLVKSTSWPVPQPQTSAKAPDGPQHYCGLSGYNPMLGDTCFGCEFERAAAPKTGGANG